MPMSPEQARINGLKGGRPKGAVDKKNLMKLREKARMDQMIVKKTAALIRAAMSPALGQIFVYRVDEEYDEDTTTINKKTGEERIVKGKLKSRRHVLVTDPEEIADALDKMEGMGHGGEREEYYYITAKEPDHKAIEMLLNRPYGKPKETVAVDVNHKFSLTSLAEERDEMLNGNYDVRDVEETPQLPTPAVELNDQVVVVETADKP